MYLYRADSHLVFGVSNRPKVRTGRYRKRGHEQLIWLEGPGDDVAAAESLIKQQGKSRSLRHVGSTLDGEVTESLILDPASVDLFFEAAALFNLRPVVDATTWNSLAAIPATGDRATPEEFASCSVELDASHVAEVHARLFSTEGSLAAAA